MALKYQGGKGVPAMSGDGRTMDRKENADGTKVVVIGRVQYQGKKGVVEHSGMGGSFHQVRLQNGTLASFHGSDLAPIGPILKDGKPVQ